MDHISLHLKTFNQKIQVMNQTNSKSLTLSAEEARNIHNEIFNLLVINSELNKQRNKSEEIISVEVNGGRF